MPETPRPLHPLSVADRRAGSRVKKIIHKFTAYATTDARLCPPNLRGGRTLEQWLGLHENARKGALRAALISEALPSYVADILASPPPRVVAWLNLTPEARAANDVGDNSIERAAEELRAKVDVFVEQWDADRPTPLPSAPTQRLAPYTPTAEPSTARSSAPRPSATRYSIACAACGRRQAHASSRPAVVYCPGAKRTHGPRRVICSA